MNSLYFIGEYDVQTNVVFMKFVNDSSAENSENIFNNSSLDILKNSSKEAGTKIWLIVDATATSFLTIKMITDISKLVKEALDNIVEDWVAVVSTPAQRVKLKILFTMIGRKQMIVSDVVDAKEIIKNLQKEKGVFPK